MNSISKQRNSTKTCFMLNMQRRFRIRFEPNIFQAIFYNLKEDCPASLVYKALGIPLLIQTPLLPPANSLFLAASDLHSFA